MANPEHLAILKQGVEAWNAWRRQNPKVRPELQGLFFSGRSWDDPMIAMGWEDPTPFAYAGANLESAKMESCNLCLIDLSTASLSSANLDRSYLTEINFDGADLRKAFLSNSRLTQCTFREADLRRAHLGRTVLRSVDFRGSDLTEVEIDHTVFIDVLLSAAQGLDKCQFRAPGVLDYQTLRAAPGLPPSFLRGCGYPENWIEWLGSLGAKAIEFYSSFISYSHTDKPFARRLHDQLQGKGIRCWLDEKDLKPGDRILDVVDGAIRLHDKLLICCSEASLQSWWVKDEIRKAQDRERKEDRNLIIPLNLDGYLFEWEDGLASDLTSRLAADFTGWKQDNDKFEAEFERVVEALRA